MTEKKDKLRALFLTALMVLSVFAGVVALSGAADAHPNHSENSTDTEVETPEDTEEEDNQNNGWLFILIILGVLALGMPPAPRH